jgi:hypothetical protein
MILLIFTTIMSILGPMYFTNDLSGDQKRQNIDFSGIFCLGPLEPAMPARSFLKEHRSTLSSKKSQFYLSKKYYATNCGKFALCAGRQPQ